ncbi:MAG: pre-peptidase C-terminal domain-containing protein [Scytonematopsis contorta HA4267-MV1]|jgi:hypothetical protein|nr:pre-peptidase C-terminal domain-containing protein [Scytonematopsis contorta HA4267-MV1]
MTFNNADNILATARKLNLTSTTQTLVDSINPNNLNDFYSFNLTSRSSFNLTLNGLSNDIDIQLIHDSNANGLLDEKEVITGSYRSGTQAESITTNLERGNYFIRIYAWNSANSSSFYNLSVSARELPQNVAPSSLSFTLNNSSVNNTGTLNISSGSVFDSNGVSDVSRIDFRIVQNGRLVADVADVISLTPNPSDSRQGNFNHSISLASLNLATGNYILQAQAFDNGNLASSLIERAFTVTPPNIAPSSLSFSLNNPIVNNTGTLNVIDGSIFDGNGVSDISRVDFRIFQNGRLVADVADVTSLTSSPNDNRQGSFGHNISLAGLNFGSGLASGNYVLQAQAFDRSTSGSNSVSNIFERNFTVTPPNIAPSSLGFTINNPSLINTGTLNISNGFVFDGNGFSDISRVDFRIIQNGVLVVDVADVTSFTPNASDNRQGNFSHTISLADFNLGSGLAAGSYIVRAQAFDRSNSVSSIVERVFTVTLPNIAPSSLGFTLNNPSVSNTGILNISAGSVSDGNGISNVSRVDFRITQNGRLVADVADVSSFTPNPNDNRQGSFSHNISLAGWNLASGNYVLQAQAFDRGNLASTIVERNFTLTPPPIAPSSLGFTINNPRLSNTEILNITSGSVSDGNGVSDISRVDFRIIQNGVLVVDVADVTSFTPNPSDNRQGNFSHNISLADLNQGSGLAVGNYILRAQAFDRSNLVSNIVERTFTVTPVPIAPSSLGFTINNPSVSNSGTLNITSGSVFDGNGVSDISRVDFRITQNGRLVADVADVTSFTPNASDNRQGSFSHNVFLSSWNLASGNYVLQAQAFDRGNLASTIVERNFTVTPPPIAPSSLGFTINNPRLSNTEILNITSGSVSDGNGVSDISRVDFRILQNGVLVVDVADVTSFTPNTSDNRQGNFTHNISLADLNQGSGLAAGSYILRAQAFDRGNLVSNIVERAFEVVGDWFSQNLRDQQIITLTRNLAADTILNRQDMMDIFKGSQDGGIVDTNELSDLRTIVNNASRFKMAEHVRVLSNKVVNSDVANQTYQRTQLGNLFAGSAAGQLEKLVQKWFLGSDRPELTSSNFVYREAQGTLFRNGIDYKDITQGQVGNCYFLAGLSVTAFRTPNVIESMFIDNGDSTFTVRFYKNDGVADYVTVDRYLATLSDINSNYLTGGNIPYAKIGGKHDNPTNELWVALAEKAYAQINESGWTLGPGSEQRVNSYQAIESGFGGGAITDITGRSTEYDTLDNSDFNSVVSAFNQGQMLYFGSRSKSEVAANVVQNHGYIMVGYNSSTQKVRLYNPWGVNGGTDEGVLKDGFLDLSFGELVKNFQGWYKTT